MGEEEFFAHIYKLGINPCVDVPEQVSRALGIRGNIPVMGMLNDTEIRSTLVPTGGGRHRLYINTDMRQRANVDTGDRVRLALRIDNQPRVVSMPEPFARALDENPKARHTWDGLRPSRHKEILIYLNWLKRPESLERNIREVIEDLSKPPEG